MIACNTGTVWDYVFFAILLAMFCYAFWYSFMRD